MPTVIQRGYDTSGRPIRASVEMWRVWDAACAVLGFTPTIVQGGWVGDDGAAASAATHAGDALDVRLWDRTAGQREAMIHVYRSHACAYWERYEYQGFDLHAHLAPGPWAHPAPQAADQWRDYLTGRNGLASHGPDYHWRPNPLVLTPPEDDMPLNDADKTWIRDTIRDTVRDELDSHDDLSESVNKHSDKADPFKGMTVRSLLKAVARKTGAV